MKTIRWGIVGTGGIAHRFAEACKNTPGAELAAVASRTAESAKSFAEEFSIENFFDSYESMAKSDKIDAAYIGTPHGLHADNAILMMNNGKAVLSEKPITLNCKELTRMIECSEKNNVFLMEAMWARVVPGTKKIMELVESGLLGKIKGIQASFCYDMSDEPEHHAFNTKYGGGSVLDVGCYALSFASYYSNSDAEEITAYADIGKDNHVDEHCCYMIKYKSGAIAQLSSGMMVVKPNEGFIFGDKGYISCRRFYAPERFEIHLNDKEVETVECPYYGNGFEEQIMEASECIRKGKTQSDFIPHSQSMYIMKQMDEIRRQVGVIYPID